jgi:hypothetical protein
MFVSEMAQMRDCAMGQRYAHESKHLADSDECTDNWFGIFGGSVNVGN